MIIPSALIKLDYNPSSDILLVEWPDTHSYTLGEVDSSLAEVLRTIRYFDVKRLLIDSRRTVVSISTEEYDAIAAAFSRELMTTRLEKLARLETESLARESQVQEISRQNNTPVAFRNFTSKEEAMDWLEAGIF